MSAPKCWLGLSNVIPPSSCFLGGTSEKNLQRNDAMDLKTYGRERYHSAAATDEERELINKKKRVTPLAAEPGR